jgi:sulfite exporter TauE/SafE
MHHLMAMSGPISAVAAFAAGAAGSVHCLAMCGGLSGALGMRARRNGATVAKASLHALTYQAGRILSYCAAGALVGGFGGLLEAAFDFNRLSLIVRFLAGAVLVIAAIGVLFKWRPLARVELLGGRLWSRVAPLARAIPTAGLRGSLLLGMIWGWLPCGLIYSMLLVAALAGGAWQGAVTMLGFGLGTVPAVLAAGLAGGQAWRVGMARGLKYAAGSLLLVFGLLTMLAPFYTPLHAQLGHP